MTSHIIFSDKARKEVKTTKRGYNKSKPKSRFSETKTTSCKNSLTTTLMIKISKKKSTSSQSLLRYLSYNFQVEIGKLKKLLETFAQQFKDPTAKNKLKDMWKNASK
jgi:hypothetical protein